jgi:hypothetical protein
MLGVNPEICRSLGSVGFMLNRYMKPEYIDILFPDKSTGWK